MRKATIVIGWKRWGVLTAGLLASVWSVGMDAQNAGDPAYRPMAGHETESLAFQAARALIFEGTKQPNGYTEPLLHTFRRRIKE